MLEPAAVTIPQAWPPPRTAPIRYRSFPFACRSVLAPLEGVSHAEFRAIIAERGGVGLVSTEFVRISNNHVTAKAMARAVVKAPGVPLCVQVMGCDEQRMAEAAELVAAAGADVVDINLGCPMPKIVKKGVGAALLKDPKRLYEILRAMRATVPGLLSAKIRAGFDTADDVVTIARTVEAAGADYIIVHPRRRKDFLDGVSDWRTIRLLKEALRIPVVGNGDCWYAQDALRMRAETGCDAVMIGRPALRNPWIFEQIADLEAGREPFRPSGRDVVGFLEATAARYDRAFTRLSSLGMLKEIVRYVGRAVPDERRYLGAALRAASTEELLQISRDALAARTADELDLIADSRLLLERSGTC